MSPASRPTSSPGGTRVVGAQPLDHFRRVLTGLAAGRVSAARVHRRGDRRRRRRGHLRPVHGAGSHSSHSGLLQPGRPLAAARGRLQHGPALSPFFNRTLARLVTELVDAALLAQDSRRPARPSARRRGRARRRRRPTGRGHSRLWERERPGPSGEDRLPGRWRWAPVCSDRQAAAVAALGRRAAGMWAGAGPSKRPAPAPGRWSSWGTSSWMPCRSTWSGSTAGRWRGLRDGRAAAALRADVGPAVGRGGGGGRASLRDARTPGGWRPSPRTGSSRSSPGSAA